MCVFCNVWVCEFVSFVMCGCVYVLVLSCVGVCVCGFCNVWVCVCVGFLMCVCMCGFFNVWVCVCVGFVMCMCFGNMCTCIYCVLYCLYCVFVLFLLCIFILICFVCTGVRTAATEWQLNCSTNNSNYININNNKSRPSLSASLSPLLLLIN
jgi:hypothetical protein